MLVAKRAQRPIPLGGITGDGIHIWDADLKVIDEILTDDEINDSVWRSFCRRSTGSPQRGRRAMALNRVLRTGVLKHIRNWSFRGVFKEMQRNLDYRAFSQFFDDEPRKVATIGRNVARIDAQALREMNERLRVIAQERAVIRGRVYRQDTTVCETNVHYPTDSSLLGDGVRVLQRVVARAQEIVPALGRARDRWRSVRRRMLDIARSTRSRGDAARKQREMSYRKLLRTVRPVVTTARQVADKLGEGRVTRHLSVLGKLTVQEFKAELDTMTPRVEGVIRQTRARVCRGITDYPDKLLSLFVPTTCVIRKGKAHKPNEFGRLVDIVEVENGFVSDYQALDGNPSDGELLIPAIERHKQRFGRPPHTVATDAGFWSAKNERDAYAAGVKRVSIPYRGKLSATRRRIQRSRWFRTAQRWRANGEGRIGILKNVYGLDRCMYKGDEAMERWLGWCVFANNLVVVARAIRRQGHSNETAATAQREDDQQAA